MFSEQAVGPVGCTTDRLHHNKLHQSGFSLMRLHGNRASSVPRRWRQRGEGGGGREGKQNRGGWEKRRGKRWRRERERESIPSLISQRGFKKRLSFLIGGASRRAGEDWPTADERRDEVEGSPGCWSLWDQDLQWPLSLGPEGGRGELLPSER